MRPQNNTTVIPDRFGKICHAAAPIFILQSIPEIVIGLTRFIQPKLDMRQYLFQRLGFAVPFIIHNPWRIVTGLFIYPSFSMFLWGSFVCFQFLRRLSYRAEESQISTARWTFLFAGLLAQISAAICNFNTPQLIGAEYVMGSIVALELFEAIGKWTVTNNTRAMVNVCIHTALNLMMLVSTGISISCCAVSAFSIYTWKNPDVFSKIGQACEQSLMNLQSWFYPGRSTSVARTEKSQEHVQQLKGQAGPLGDSKDRVSFARAKEKSGYTQQQKRQMARWSISNGGVTISDLQEASSMGISCHDWFASKGASHKWGLGQKLGL